MKVNSSVQKLRFERPVKRTKQAFLNSLSVDKFRLTKGFCQSIQHSYKPLPDLFNVL